VLEKMPPRVTTIHDKSYGRLLQRTRPHVIRTDEEYERLTAELLRLDELEKPTREEDQLGELLTILIEEYEERRYPIPPSTPRQTLLHLMEARGLTQKDLWKVFGSEGITSEVFHGKRSISKSQAKKLAAFFHVSPDLFI
jgi:HTH-type transcriptional regulator / antitoxin HigA